MRRFCRKGTGSVRRVTLESRLRTLLLAFFVPVLAMVLITFLALITYVNKYSDILHNVTTASDFNQDFKESIDLKMYYYVVDSHYSEGLPIEEVKAAQELAKSLRKTTTQRESWNAINDVLNLCTNLESKIYLIEETDTYDDRQIQLENNIYVLTKLIQDYMYKYLYYEAALLDSLHLEIMRRLHVEIALIAVAAAALLLWAIRSFFRFGRSITQPISDLCRRVQAIGDGDLTAKTPVQAQEYEIQTLSDGFENMVGRLNQLIEQNKQEQISLRSAELALLQAQINPHFLYNTLDAIVWLVEMGKNEQAVEMVTSLSSFFRSSLSQGRDIISLREEEQHVRSYLEIQQVRYRDILDYRIEIDPGLSDCEIPKLTLQPLVENALYHGIKLKRGLGHIVVTGEQRDGMICLTVSDDGAGMTMERLQELRRAIAQHERVGFGVVTVYERLQLLFGPTCTMTIESSPGAGTTFCVKIPMRRSGAQQNGADVEAALAQGEAGHTGAETSGEAVR